MPLYHSLDYYFSKGELPLKDNFHADRINHELGTMLSLDVHFPLYQVKDMEPQSLEKTYIKSYEYLEKAFSIMKSFYRNEELNIDNQDLTLDLEREIIYTIEAKIGIPRPLSCYPIYIITAGPVENERVVYIGKTSSIHHRFAGGHSAALKLHHPKYDGLEKTIYFATIMSLSKEGEYMPLELVQPYSSADEILSNIEAGLIYNLKPELNTVHINKDNVHFRMGISIENNSERSSILRNMSIGI